MQRKTRLKRKSSKARTNRLETEGISGVMNEGQEMLKDSTKGMAIKIGSSEFMDENVEDIVQKARVLMDKNRGKDVMLKVELYTEPGDSAGVFFFVHAEDLANYDRLQAEDADTGNIYTISRGNIMRIMGHDTDDKLQLNNPSGMNIAG